jgi:hypothetical protein
MSAEADAQPAGGFEFGAALLVHADPAAAVLLNEENPLSLEEDGRVDLKTGRRLWGDEPQLEQLPESAVPRALAEAHIATFDPVAEPERLNRIRDPASHRGALVLVKHHLEHSLGCLG